MIDYCFYENFGPFSLIELAKIGQCQFVTAKESEDNLPGQIMISSISTLEDAVSSEICVLNNKKYLNKLAKSMATACILEEKYIDSAPPKMHLLVSKNPYKSFALISSKFFPEYDVVGSISPAAHVHPTAQIGKNCLIEAGAVIGEYTIIGNNTKIGPNTVIGKSCVIGINCSIGPNVTISHAIIGKNTIIHTGVRIGQDGFGFASDMHGHYKIPQVGRVLIGNNVEIGANTCIDRGSLRDTVIGDNCMIDNLVQIGHNVNIGRCSVVVAQVGIAGSTTIGDFVQLGGQVGVAGHLELGDGAKIAAGSGVIRDVPKGETQGGYPAVPVMEWHRSTASIKKLTKKEKRGGHE